MGVMIVYYASHVLNLNTLYCIRLSQFDKISNISRQKAKRKHIKRTSLYQRRTISDFFDLLKGIWDNERFTKLINKRDKNYGFNEILFSTLCSQYGQGQFEKE